MWDTQMSHILFTRLLVNIFQEDSNLRSECDATFF